MILSGSAVTKAANVDGRFASSWRANSSSEAGSKRSISKPAMEAHSATSLPSRAIAIVAHMPPGMLVPWIERTSGSRPRGPGNGCTSEFEPSAWIVDRPGAARWGCSGAIPASGCAVAAVPTKRGAPSTRAPRIGSPRQPTSTSTSDDITRTVRAIGMARMLGKRAPQSNRQNRPRDRFQSSIIATSAPSMRP